MGAISNIYLLIFLPLIASLFCQITSGKRIPFYLSAFVAFISLILALRIFPDVLVNEKISNDFYLSILSLALEFKLDLLALGFFIPLLILKIIIIFFFRFDIEKSLLDSGVRNFYSVFLLHLFALSGIFTANNIFNLFLFFEIYAFSFFAISSISNETKLLKITFSYFCLSAVSSLIIIFCFFVIYLSFGEVNFDQLIILFNLAGEGEYWFIKIIFLLLAVAFVLKFFPLWLYFEKIKSTSLITGFMVIDSLFVKSLVGIFLIVKFCYLFFGTKLIFLNFGFDHLLLVFASFLIFYSSYKLYNQKHLKLICAYLSLNNLGFIIAAIALQNLESLQAMFFYLLSFCLVNLFIFLFATFLKRHFGTSAINKLWLIRETSLALTLPFKLLLFFIAAFPLSFLFFANWHLMLATMKFGFESVIFIGLILSNFIYIFISFQIVKALFFNDKKTDGDEEEIEEGEAIELQNRYFYLASFWLLIIMIYGAIFFIETINNFALSLASYLLSNTI